MFYAETAQGLESGAIVGTITETDDVFVWWIPVLAVVNTIVIAAILSLLIPKAPKSKKRRRDDDDDDDDYFDDDADFDGEITCGAKKYAVLVKEID